MLQKLQTLKHLENKTTQVVIFQAPGFVQCGNYKRNIFFSKLIVNATPTASIVFDSVCVSVCMYVYVQRDERLSVNQSIINS